MYPEAMHRPSVATAGSAAAVFMALAAGCGDEASPSSVAKTAADARVLADTPRDADASPSADAAALTDASRPNDASTLMDASRPSDASTPMDASHPNTGTDASTATTDITNAAFTDQSPACSAHAGRFVASVSDLSRGVQFSAQVQVQADAGGCTITSNGIPNHDFGSGSHFATPVAEVVERFHLPASPRAAPEVTPLSLRYDNGIFLDGVKLDRLAAACYGVGQEPLGKEKIGCMQEGTPWRYDPMSPNNSFGTDDHNAHTQPDGAYHYHGDPKAMYDESGHSASGVIGFAADGFPIFGPYIDDDGTVRKVMSGYTLKPGARTSQPGEGAFPGGDYDGTFIDDYEFTDHGDLDRCNGMTRDGAYGYYVTGSYPWVVGCFTGTPDDTFRKAP